MPSLFCISLASSQLRFVPPTSANRRPPLQSWQSHPLLPLVLAFLVFVGDLGTFLTLEKKNLSNAFVGVDLGRQRRRVRDLECDESFPLRLERCDVSDYPTSRVSRLS